MTSRKRPILTTLVIIAVVAAALSTGMILLLKVLIPSAGLFFREHIGVVEVEGIITDARPITQQLVNFEKDRRIKAVIVRIDSPGGSVGPSQEIYAQIRRLIRRKPVVASLGAVAASGGYYVASAASRIVANPGTITGSIGVLMEFIRVEDLLDKIGISLEVLKSGEFKDLGSPHRKLTSKERALIDELLQDIQMQFVQAVARGRSLPPDKVGRIADGRVFSGARAKELGLVDRLGNFQDAVALARELAGIEGEPELVYERPRGFGLWERILREGVRRLSDLFQGIPPRIQYRWHAPGIPAPKETD